MISILFLFACNTDLNELLNRLEGEEDAAANADSGGDAAETVDDMGNELDGYPVGTDSDRIAILLDGSDYSGTRIVISPVEGPALGAPTSIALTMGLSGPLSIAGACCDANGEDLSLELLAYRLMGNATAGFDDAGSLVLSGLEDASRDGVLILPEDPDFFAMAAVPSALAIANQPTLQFGGVLSGDDGIPTSIIGITIESDVTPESYVVGGLEILDDKVFTTGLDDAGFDTCRLDIYDGEVLLRSWDGPCGSIELPIWLVPAEGESSLGMIFTSETTDNPDSPFAFSLKVISAREAASGMATGK